MTTNAEHLVTELKKYHCLCYYPASGADLSNLDFFASGRLLWEERRRGLIEPAEAIQAAAGAPEPEPDLYLHTDVTFLQEFAAGKDLDASECGIHGPCEIIGFRELPALEQPNVLYDTCEYSGKCFEYKLRLWNSPTPKTLIFCLCENEFFVANILLAHQIEVPYVWSRNWNGGKTYGTWLINVLDRLRTRKFYTDWLCVPGQRGQPANRLVEERYPELMGPPNAQLVRNNDIHWIDEGAHGWVEEFLVQPR